MDSARKLLIFPRCPCKPKASRCILYRCANADEDAPTQSLKSAYRLMVTVEDIIDTPKNDQAPGQVRRGGKIHECVVASGHAQSGNAVHVLPFAHVERLDGEPALLGEAILYIQLGAVTRPAQEFETGRILRVGVGVIQAELKLGGRAHCPKEFPAPDFCPADGDGGARSE